jgi:drug/metabolite transporter (DMT)-like permease
MLAIVLVLLAAVANATALVLLRKATEAEGAHPTFSLPMLWVLVRQRPVWGAGISAIATGAVLQFCALSNGPLSVVQLVILIELPFTLIGARLVLGGRLRTREWSAILAMTAGLIVVLFTLSPSGGDPFSADLLTWLIGLAATVAVAITALVLARRSTPATRTALFGVATGVVSGLIAVLAKAVAVAAADGIAAVIATWQTWALIAAAVGGFFLLQNALQAGRLAASQPGITLANPAVALVWGVGLFHEHVLTGWWLVGTGLGAGLLTGGAVLLSRSPLLAPHRQGSERDT